MFGVNPNISSFSIPDDKRTKSDSDQSRVSRSSEDQRRVSRTSQEQTRVSRTSEDVDSCAFDSEPKTPTDAASVDSPKAGTSTSGISSIRGSSETSNPEPRVEVFTERQAKEMRAKSSSTSSSAARQSQGEEEGPIQQQESEGKIRPPLTRYGRFKLDMQICFLRCSPCLFGFLLALSISTFILVTVLHFVYRMSLYVSFGILGVSFLIGCISCVSFASLRFGHSLWQLRQHWIEHLSSKKNQQEPTNASESQENQETAPANEAGL